MSLAIRIGEYVNISFMTIPTGLSLNDIEKTIEIYEGKYFNKYESQNLIVDCMCFTKKSIIEQRDVTKFFSIHNLTPFWKYQGDKYFLADSKFKLNDEDKQILWNLDKVKIYNEKTISRLNIISILTNNPKGVRLDNLYNFFLDFNKKFNFYTYLAKEYNLNEENLIEESFVDIMGFNYAEPYKSVYLDKKDEEKLKKGGFAHKPFIDWEYKNGLYYPASDWLEENKEKIKKSEKTIKSLVRIIESKTLLNFIQEYCILEKKTNSEFLREHIYMQANLDSLRK